MNQKISENSCFLPQNAPVVSAQVHLCDVPTPACLKRRAALNTEKDVMERIEAAVKVLRCLPPVRVQGYGSGWPDMPTVPSVIESEAGDTVPFRPTPWEVDDMEDVIFHWFKPLSTDDKRMLWKRAGGMGWKRLAFEYGASIRTMQRRVHKLLGGILDTLRQTVRRHKTVYDAPEQHR